MVIDGSKPHTIRKRRKKGYAKKGDTLYLYYGLRTKQCKKLREEICTGVYTIIIDVNSNNEIVILLYTRVNDNDINYTDDGKLIITNMFYDRQVIVKEEAALLAWMDGFRPDGSIKENPGISSEMMLDFFKKEHGLPFIGDMIFWNKEPIK